MQLPDRSHVEQNFDGKIRFGHRASATFRLHISSYDTVTLEDDVMIAFHVYIGVATHGYMEMRMP